MRSRSSRSREKAPSNKPQAKGPGRIGQHVLSAPGKGEEEPDLINAGKEPETLVA
jgi:hypothetical protein